MVVCGSALLLRYSEGATLLAIVMVSFSTPLKPASDQHVISPYRNTAESFIKITRINDCKPKRLWLLNRLSFPEAKEMSREEYREYGLTDV